MHRLSEMNHSFSSVSSLKLSWATATLMSKLPGLRGHAAVSITRLRIASAGGRVD